MLRQLSMLFIYSLSFVGSPELYAAKVKWPNLKYVKYTSGRAATQQDLNDRRAAFVLKLKGIPAGEPLNIEIPQYAFFVDQATGEKSPVVIIQAEHIRKFEAYGYIDVVSGEIKVAQPDEITLLGTKKPR